MKLDSYHMSYTKINSKWIKNLNLRVKTIKLLEEKGEIFMTFGLSMISWIWHQKHREQEKKIDKLDFIKVKNLGFPGGAVVENLPANAGDTGSSPGLGRSHMPRSSWAQWATIAEPARLEPVPRDGRGRDRERPAHRDEERSPHRDEEWPPRWDVTG